MEHGTEHRTSGHGFKIVTGNRLGRLLAHLAEELHRRPLPPLEREIVIVQSQGMQRWLTLELARHRGLAASLTTPFPRPFIRHLFAQRDPSTRRPPCEPIGRFEETLFSRELLLWRLVEHLGGGEASRHLAAPRAYLADDTDQRKLYQLCQRLAALFDDYQLYRGDLLKRWEEGEESEGGPERWQAALWRQLVETPPPGERKAEPDAGGEPLHRGLEALIAQLRRLRERPPWLPRRLSVLGVSSLPPAFVELLVALGERLPVTVYLLSPTYHYWADLRSERETARLERRFAEDRARGPEWRDQHFESGHPLLASLGKQGRELFDLLQRADEAGSAWHEEAFEEPGEDGGVLASLQRDVLHLHAADAEPAEKRRLDASDRSLAVHVCHSPMREMQVLHHELLRAFEEIDDLRPSDVLVLLPDIEGYVPYIQAVFGGDRDGVGRGVGGAAPALPFSIADRGAGREQPPSEVILQILDLASSRFTLRDVFDLLETPALRRTAGLLAEDVTRLRRLFEQAGVRWGISGEHRAALWDVPADDANTWRMGLDRLLMGYATGRLEDRLAGHGDVDGDVNGDIELVAGIDPAAGDTAGDAESLGSFAALLERLEGRLGQIRRRHSLGAWAEIVASLVDDFLEAEDEDEERGLQLVRQAAEELAAAAEKLGAKKELSAAVLREHLASRLQLEGFGSGFLNGQVTFCALRPMRTIPFRVVAVAGLEAGIFPRRDRRPGFDLTAREPRLGDRSVREDDRYLFLETLLATEERLILTYVGRSQQDGSVRQPSAVLSELLEELDRRFEGEDGGPAREQIVRVHPLQAWSAAYFRQQHRQERPSSYSAEQAAVARALAAERQPEPRLLDGVAPQAVASADLDRDIDASDTDVLEVSLDELIRFWQSPCRFFVERTLAVSLPAGENAERDAEPFALRGLEGWPVREWLTERRIRDRAAGRASDPEAERIRLRARGLLPPGHLGDAALAETIRDIEAWLERVPEHRALPLLPLDITIDDGDRRFRLGGTLESACDLQLGDPDVDGGGEVGVLRYRCGRLRPADWLQLWCEHLVFALLDQPPTQARAGSSYLVGVDASWRLRPPEAPRRILGGLLRAFAEGGRRPLPFFGEASQAFAEQQWALADPRRSASRPPIELARAVFEGRDGPPRSQRPPPLAEDPWIRLAFRGRRPLDEPDFEILAERVWRPIFENRRELD